MNNPMSEDEMREKILSEISQNSAIITPEAIARKTLSVPGLFEAIYSAKNEKSSPELFFEYLASGIRPEDLMGYLSALSLADFTHEEASLWRIRDSQFNRPGYRVSGSGPSHEFNYWTEEFSNHLRSVNYENFSRSLDDPTLLLLRLALSEEQVITTAQAFRKSERANNLFQFYQICSNWETYSVYPIEWSLSILDRE